MKVIFICRSIEDGRDGVGDYVQKLAQTIATMGIQPILVAANDSYVDRVESGVKNGTSYHRLPKSLSWKTKANEIENIININGPIDWISVQFVSYTFNDKGIILKEKVFFEKLKKHKIHVMMHEVWVGDEKEASLKMKLLGFVQRISIISIIRYLNPQIINVTVPLYKKILERFKFKVSVLPLFSNIDHNNIIAGDFDGQTPKQLLANRNNYVLGCLFGSIYHDSWDLSSLLNPIMVENEKSHKKIIIVSLGKISYGQEFWDSLPVKYPQIEFITLGPKNEDFIAYWLTNFVDFGINTTPAVIAAKSSACMSLLEFGIPIFCNRNNLTFNFKITDDIFDERFIQVGDNFKFHLPKRLASFSQRTKTANSFVQSLKSF